MYCMCCNTVVVMCLPSSLVRCDSVRVSFLQGHIDTTNSETLQLKAVFCSTYYEFQVCLAWEFGSIQCHWRAEPTKIFLVVSAASS